MITQKRYIKKVIVNDPQSSTEARAERLRRVRNMANLSREEMCQGEGLNINTYKGWEIARYGGLPSDGAEKTVLRVAKEGVVCTIDWLLHGVGIGPYVVPDYQKATHPQQPLEYDSTLLDYKKQPIYGEIKLFKKQFSNAVIYEIEDDGLAPFYQPGEFVAGIPRYKEQIKEILNQNCIVQTETGIFLARYLRAGEKPNTYTLACSNIQTSVKKMVLYDVPLLSAALIIRHYRYDPE